MADHHHHRHRPSLLSLPPRTTASVATPKLFPYAVAVTPTPTPSKTRIPYLSTKYSTSKTSSISFLFLLLFSLRSLYSLLPFLRSSPSSFSIFPFAFLVSLLSFLLSLAFTLLTPTSSSKAAFRLKQVDPVFSLTSITKSQCRYLLAKSALLAVVFLLRFQALRYCGTAAMILAELSGNVAARFAAERNNPYFMDKTGFRFGSSKVRGFIALLCGMIMLSLSWDRVECFPLSSVNVSRLGVSIFPGINCVRIWPMLLPFLSGFLGCYERVSTNWGAVRELGRKRVRLISLFITTVLLFIPAVISMFVFEAEGDSISVTSLAWALGNTVVFGVLLSENYYNDEKMTASKDFQKEYLVTFVCTVVLELIYFPDLSLWGLLISGLLLWFSASELDPFRNSYLELGVDSSDWFSTSVMKPVRHILSERKSRKIALFLLINTAYMVVEFVAGFMSNSLGLISDACHMLFDCAALAIGLYASYISRLPANSQFNYGRGRFEVLSGYVNAVFLVLVGALIVLESFERILDPQEISTSSLLVVSVGGLLVNVVGLIFFHDEHHHAHGGSGSCTHSHHHSHDHDHHHHEILLNNQDKGTVVHDSHKSSCSNHDHDHGHEHHLHHDHDHHNIKDKNHDHDHHNIKDKNHDRDHHNIKDKHHDHDHHNIKDKHEEEPNEKHQHHHIDHNMEGIFLHVLADTLGSVGVVVATLLIKYKGWLVADPACSFFISILIIYSVIPLLRNSGEVLLQRVPKSLQKDLRKALNRVLKMDGVCGIQNLHFWSLTNTDVVGALHLLVSKEADKEDIKARVGHLLSDAGIKDLTLQVECIKE